MNKKIINSRAREIIIQVDNYFVQEKEDAMLLLQNVTRSLKAALDTSEDVVMSKKTVLEISKYLQNTTKVTERVMSATGISKNTVAKLRREKQTAVASGSKIKTPVKKKRGKKEFLDGFSLTALRNIINSIYIVRKEVPTMRKIMAAAKQDLDYKGSETTLRQIMKDNLGYKFKKCYQKRLTLIERPNIQAWRAKYLRRMKENDSLGADKKPVIYIDETWIHAHYTVKKCWQSATDVGVKKNESPGRRWIIVHAGSESGFVDGALLMFKANSKTGDYHDQMNTENFSKWLKEKLIPNIPPNCIIVMDNAPYHSKEEDRTPNMGSKKEEMIKWLQANNIEFTVHNTKPELYLLIKNHKVPKKYIMDKLAEHGHEVVRLPPYNCDLNPIEYIWNLVKQRVSDKNVEQLESRIETITLEALQSITPDDWKKEVNHVKKLI
ncbi:unnamed protein product [Colias eurytheme]|nr:unnamed protein product [Colias eurytheme]